MTKEERLKKRYNSEKRFKFYGILSKFLGIIDKILDKYGLHGCWPNGPLFVKLV